MTTRLNTIRLVPIILAVGIVLGILIGSFYANHFGGRRLSIINASSNKISDLLHLIDDQYVDTVNMADLVEKSLPNILRELDPHSTYVGAADVEMEMQGLEGHFSGIGIQFYILRDTVNIVKVIEGGPSDGSGLRPGDRIVAVDGKNFTGKDINEEKARKALKGPKGSTVRLTVARPSAGGKAHQITVTRGNVPVESIDAVYMLDDTTGYISIRTFASTTYSEFISALAQLRSEGFERLILDLRGNLGGYMEPAVQMANEFLPAGRLIVYTEGRRSPRENFRSDGRGTYQHMPLVVLVDEYSASASEIFAGAMQDNDRARIVGRRTFGKGLVQVPIEFRDGSLLRLTKARYYTPSGRCVQKPYQHGDPEDSYSQDLINRELGGELFNADSIKTNGKVYRTVAGRKVYGGGGIIPDVFVPLDTLGFTSYLKEASMRGLIQEFAYAYTDSHRDALEEKDDLAQYLLKAGLPDQFATYAEHKGLRRRNNLLRQSYALFNRYIIRFIVDDIQGTEAAIRFYNEQDPALKQAFRQ
ncbi:MAG: S41 family peptidase [Bacteroidales bacterium]|nr:S41 family peptidase [Candidatus Equimonas faecalis]